MDNRIGSCAIKFVAVCVFQTDDIAGKFNNGKLHAQTKTKIRNLVFTSIADSANHAFDTTVAKTTGNDNAIYIRKEISGVIITQQLGINPFNINFCIIGNGAVFKSFYHTDVSVMKGNIFPNKCDTNRMFRIFPGVDHGNPVGKIWLWAIHVQAIADNIGQFFFFHSQFVKNIHIKILNDSFLWYITKLRNFFFNAVIQRQVGTADKNIRLNAHTLKILYAGLRWFGFQFAGSFKIWNQRNMNENTIFVSYLMLELTKRFQKRLTFNVADGSSDFDNGYFGFRSIFIMIKSAFNFIGDMWDNLYGMPTEIPTSFFI